MFRQFLHFLLFSSLFISLCAVALALETNLLMGLPLHSFGFYCFVFGATLFQYNLHYAWKKKAVVNSERFAWTSRFKVIHYVMILVAVACIGASFLSFYLQHYVVLFFLGVIGAFYSFPLLPVAGGKRLKDFGILKILTLSLLWTLVTVWFPVNAMEYDPALFWLVFIKRFLFMFALCLLFDIRDMDVDKESGSRTIPVRAGVKASYQIAHAVLLLFAALSVVHFLFWGNAGTLTAMFLSAGITMWVIEATRRNQSDTMFLAGIDGMMLLQALLVWVFNF